MDVRILTCADRSEHESLFDQMHRQRHDVFAAQLNWKALRSRDQREHDQFDDADARYLIACKGGEVHGSLRLLPAWRRSMLLECWPHAVDAALRAFDERTWEWTRWCPGVATRPRQLLAARRALILAAVAFGQAQGARRFVTLCETKFVNQLSALDWRPEALGLPFAYAEGEAIGVRWHIRPNALLDTAARLRAPRLTPGRGVGATMLRAA